MSNDSTLMFHAHLVIANVWMAAEYVGGASFLTKSMAAASLVMCALHFYEICRRWWRNIH